MSPCNCPNCGYQLQRLEDFDLGDLHVSGEFGMVAWRGQVPHLTKTERAIVLAIAMAKGRIITRQALIEAGGFEEVSSPSNQLAQFIHRIRDAFLEVDPAFDKIRNEHGIGYRWVAGAHEELAA